MRALVLACVALTSVGSACSKEPDRAAPDYISIEYRQGAAGAVAPITDAVLTRTDEGKPTLFTTPHFEIVQAEVLVTDVLDGSTAEAVGLGDGQSLASAPGHEFVVAELEGSRDVAGASPENGVTATVELAAGEQRLKLTERPANSFERVVVAASVPKGDPVSLRVDDAGQVVSWDLREARYADDPVSQMAAIYGQVRGQNLNGSPEPETTGVVLAPPAFDFSDRPDLAGLFPEQRGELVLTLDLGRAAFQISPYVSGLGWAPEGTVWAEVFGFTVNYRSELITVFPGIGSVAEPPESFTMTGVDGQVYPLVNGNAALGTVSSDLLDTQHAVFRVPADFTRGTFSFAPQAPVSGIGAAGLDVTVTWTQLPAPITIPVNLAG
ncbi:MAG: hypothetical protein ABIV94_10755 [Acidimicrobiales bacterium]